MNRKAVLEVLPFLFRKKEKYEKNFGIGTYC